MAIHPVEAVPVGATPPVREVAAVTKTARIANQESQLPQDTANFSAAAQSKQSSGTKDYVSDRKQVAR